jgi:hypothetical protein
MTRPLFIIGNKRSGTSQLVRLLNLHPQVFVSHESDIIWILYQFHHGLPFRAHPWDSDKGMRLTLQLCGHWLRRGQSPRQNALAVQCALMEAGSPWLPPQKKTNLLWIGDKKPFLPLGEFSRCALSPHHPSPLRRGGELRSLQPHRQRRFLARPFDGRESGTMGLP